MYRRRDLFLAAKILQGKSIIIQAILLLVRASITIIILPLNVIREEQLLKIRAILGVNPVFIYTEVIKAYTDIIKYIKAGQFTHILILLELLLSKRFHHILTQPAFRLYISLVIINKYYLVTNWGKSFRPYYAQLFKVRLLLGLIVPQFIYTIILNKEIYIKVIKLVGFYQSIIEVLLEYNRS